LVKKIRHLFFRAQHL